VYPALMRGDSRRASSHFMEGDMAKKAKKAKKTAKKKTAKKKK
jgi:hypothetical protein